MEMDKIINNFLVFSFPKKRPDAYMVGDKVESVDDLVMGFKENIKQCALHQMWGENLNFKDNGFTVDTNTKEQFIYNMENWYKCYTAFNCKFEQVQRELKNVYRQKLGQTERENSKIDDSCHEIFKGWTPMLRMAHREWGLKRKREEDK